VTFLQKKQPVVAKNIRDWQNLLRYKGTPNPMVIPNEVVPTMDDSLHIAQQIGLNRMSIPNHADKLIPQKNGGYMYAGKFNVKPSGVKDKLDDTEDIEARINTVLWKELGSEGGVSSINTYDNQKVTWGKGMGAKGLLPETLNTLFATNPEIKNMFLDAGIALNGHTWRVVNTQDGLIYTGDAALQIIQSDTQLLSLLIEIGENEKYNQASVEAQWKTVRKNAGKVPDYVYDKTANRYKSFWSDEAVALVAHLAHWLPGTSWQFNSYESTQGDILAIALLFGQIYAKTLSKPKLPNGISFVSSEIFDPMSSIHLGVFGAGVGKKGVALQALRANCSELRVPREALASDLDFSNRTIFELSKGHYLVYPVLDAATLLKYITIIE
jgi:hypothetical protein